MCRLGFHYKPRDKLSENMSVACRCFIGRNNTNAFPFKKRFDAFMSIIHAKASEDADENGDSPKRFQEWSILEKDCSSNGPFPVWVHLKL